MLMRKLGKRQLSLSLAQPLAELPGALATLPLALSDDRQSLIYTFDAHAGDAGIASLLARLGEHGIAWKDLATRESSLEDIFVDLVHGART